MISDRVWLRLGYFLVVALVLTGCSSVIRAQVIDAETKQPIQGAVVLGVWTKVGGLPGMTVHETIGVRETETDSNGRFELERMRSSGLPGEGGGQAITVYKFGYVAWSNLFVFPSSELRSNQRIPGTIALERFPPNASHRKHLNFILNATSGHAETSRAPKLTDAISKESRLP